jgi:hypothetical protein
MMPVITGELARNAEIRSQLSADGQHTTAVVRVELGNIKGIEANRIVLMLPCDDYVYADQRAKELLKGRCIRFTAPLEASHLTFPKIDNNNIQIL